MAMAIYIDTKIFPKIHCPSRRRTPAPPTQTNKQRAHVSQCMHPYARGLQNACKYQYINSRSGIAINNAGEVLVPG